VRTMARLAIGVTLVRQSGKPVPLRGVTVSTGHGPGAQAMRDVAGGAACVPVRQHRPSFAVFPR
jgi:hypothetical protein